MSVHLYNLGADMDISNGLDRVGKVVFWLSFLVMAGVTALLAMGDTRSDFPVWLGVLTIFTVVVSLHTPKGAKLPPSIWWGTGTLWYNLAIIAWLMNQLPRTDVYLAIVVYAIPVVLLGVLRWIARYIVKGFTQKT
jgi:hypothetical protein